MGAKSLKQKLLLKASVLAIPFVLVGCSSIPDAANPVEWYRSTVDYFSSDEEEEMASQSDAGAPSEAAAPAETATSGEEKELPSGFVAAKKPTREYAQPVMRQGDVVNPLGESTVVSNEPPAPSAAPTSPVTTREMAQVSTSSTPVQSAGSVMPASTPVQPVAELDNRSVGEIYAENLAQTRPTLMPGMMSTSDIVMQPFDTVVVSGSGVMRQQNTYAAQQMPPQQYAALNSTSQMGYSLTSSGAMAVEPAVVREGRAHSMTRYNPVMYNGSYQVATIQFGIGSDNLTLEDKRILGEVLNIHRQHGGVIRVVGHASSRTRDMTPQAHMKVNHSVSLSRADKVARELLRQGVPGERLFVGGVSDSQPLYQEVMPSGEAGNRRTEIYVDY